MSLQRRIIRNRPPWFLAQDSKRVDRKRVRRIGFVRIGHRERRVETAFRDAHVFGRDGLYCPFILIDRRGDRCYRVIEGDSLI